MNDYGVTGATTGAEVLLKLPVDAVWAGITAIDRYGEWSPECYYGAWLDDADRPVRGARFEARNRFADGYETYVRAQSRSPMSRCASAGTCTAVRMCPSPTGSTSCSRRGGSR